MNDKVLTLLFVLIIFTAAWTFKLSTQYLFLNEELELIQLQIKLVEEKLVEVQNE